MLVFSRKIGQQVVLPEQGVTIDVMEVGRTGACAWGFPPPPIFRSIAVRCGIGSAAEAAGRRRTAAARQTALRLMKRRARRRRALVGRSRPMPGTVDYQSHRRSNQRLVRRKTRWPNRDPGFRGSYYVRQLAQAAVEEVLNACNRLSLGPVEYNIDVAQVYWRSGGHTHGLTRLGGTQQ